MNFFGRNCSISKFVGCEDDDDDDHNDDDDDDDEVIRTNATMSIWKKANPHLDSQCIP